MSFYTISMDEYYRPFDNSGNFNFQNWQSFVVFLYLILSFIFGFILTQNLDNKDIAKLNDMDISEEFQMANNDTNAQILFPLQSFALKR